MPSAKPAINAPRMLFKSPPFDVLDNKGTTTPWDWDTWLMASLAESLGCSLGSKDLNKYLAFFILETILEAQSVLYCPSKRYTGDLVFIFCEIFMASDEGAADI
ncbi:hypothetical protein CGH28_18455 [Vibrio parahaemolyticus]|nr:hypothetical protein CGH28_18455 [Vibrio parahaemolyticus]